MPRRILLIGGGAREHAIGEAICARPDVELFVLAHNHNPGLQRLAKETRMVDERNVKKILRLAKDFRVDLAVIGLEDPLAVGLPDVLEQNGIPVVGPVRDAALVETSKLFLRRLMDRFSIGGQIEYQSFTEPMAAEQFLRAAQKPYALKPIGLTAGKGVKVMGVQLHGIDEAVEYAASVIQDGIGGTGGILLEERLFGVEFTLQAFTDGETVVPMPLVKDYKLALEGDRGPNTGSMGAYSQSDFLLDFVSADDYAVALGITGEIIRALSTTGVRYRGVIYGQFMKTPSGVRLVEVNARFGDPEAINVLSLLRTDFLDVCDAIVGGTLGQLEVRFEPQSTVCKYVTPWGYPTDPELHSRIDLDLDRIQQLGVRVFFAKVDQQEDYYVTTPSRSIALLGVANTVEEAQSNVESALGFVRGRYHVRRDIGTRELRDRAIQQLAELASVGSESDWHPRWS